MQLDFWKTLVYVLTFITYVYSGFGAGILGNIRDAVVSAQNVFGDTFSNIINVAKKFKNLNDVFDAAVNEDCVYKCPVNGVQPRPNKNHVPKADGCGSLGLSIKSEFLPIADMTKCCDDHDICYDTCNKDKEMCDIEFKKCLYRYCDKYQKSVGENVVKGCKAAAKLLFTGTLTLGCKSYLDAQGKACFCPNIGWKDNRNKKYAKGDGEL
ncbi:group XIIA secretory phospholipase A2 [Onthophagus taurus]|uniref:group XIIA secretory phospholipase A2 n=1 Tax=Onthophagus taurus TaxID=166361 RepID=UPI0039BECCDC